MSKLVLPHGGGSLKPLLAPIEERAEALSRGERLKRVPVTSREVSDLFMLGMGAYTPLDGYMGYDDWRGSVTEMRLTNGVFWPLPITLSLAKDVADSINVGEEVALTDGETGDLLGLLTVREKYAIDRELECKHVFRTTDPKHPGVEKVMRQGEVNVGGPIIALSEGAYPAEY
jgi:sulfate adenylyltransferase